MSKAVAINPGEIKIKFTREDGSYGRTIKFIPGTSLDLILTQVELVFIMNESAQQERNDSE